MANRTAKKQGRCVHCLRLTDHEEADHVFPRSWNPETTSTAVQRWTAPSCPVCNRELGKLEEDLLIRIALCLDPRSAAARGLLPKVLRSMGLDVDDLSNREARIRMARRAKLSRELLPRLAGYERSRIPGLGPNEIEQQTSKVLPIPTAGLAILAEKVVRGCEYCFKNRRRFVDAPYGVRVFIRDTPMVPEPFASHGHVIDLGPGCRIKRVFTIEDPNIVLYWISLWESLHLHVRIDNEQTLLKAEPRWRRFAGITQLSEAMLVSTYLRNIGRQRIRCNAVTEPRPLNSSFHRDS